jgi:cell division protein FtsQ
MKKTLFIIISTLLVAYLVASIIYFSKKTIYPPLCTEVEIIIKDSIDKPFLSKNDIILFLKSKKAYPLNKKNEDINTSNIESELQKNQIIEEAEVIQTLSGKIKIVVSQKMPILRVFSNNGNYYIDNTGATMPSSLGHAVYVPVASGNIEKSFAQQNLYDFALFLHKNDFWNDQIEQIYVDSKGEIELVPRVGNHRILLGSLDNYEIKLRNLRLFYEQVIPKMGWDKYNVINLKFQNQIVCTKK